VAALAILTPGFAFAGDAVEFARGEVTITTQTGDHIFNVEIARTPTQHARGLMFRESMSPDEGMLFVFDSPREIAMWMKNTLISLDMIFVNAAGKIIRVARDTTPMSEDTIPSGGPSKAVVELNAGTAARISVQAGDQVFLPTIAP
jgi:uncharacterized membrane protein (UPF0127 family)